MHVQIYSYTLVTLNEFACTCAVCSSFLILVKIQYHRRSMTQMFWWGDGHKPVMEILLSMSKICYLLVYNQRLFGSSKQNDIFRILVN